MQIIRDPADTALIADPELCALVQKTIAALSEDYPYDPDVLGYFLIVQPGDSLAMLNAQIGFDILANKWTGIRFDQPGYNQSFEILDEHAGYYEMVFLIDDSGFKQIRVIALNHSVSSIYMDELTHCNLTLTAA